MQGLVCLRRAYGDRTGNLKKKNEMHCMEIQTLNCCVCPSHHAENVEGT